MKRKRELELVMDEIKKLTSESSYTDLENAVNRGLKNIRIEKYEDNLARKEKSRKRKSDDANAANPC